MVIYRFFPDKEYVFKSLREKRLKISTLEDLNDQPFEFLACDLSEAILAPAMIKTRETVWSNKGIICFSETFEEPLMWAHYADNNKGLCLGFEISEQAQGSLTKISYVPKRIQWDENIDEKTMNKILTSKFKNWGYEKEIRLNFALNDSEDGMYFVDFNDVGRHTEILIGTRSSIKKEYLLSTLGEMSSPVDICKVVPHKEEFKLVKSTI